MNNYETQRQQRSTIEQTASFSTLQTAICQMILTTLLSNADGRIHLCVDYRALNCANSFGGEISFKKSGWRSDPWSLYGACSLTPY